MKECIALHRARHVFKIDLKQGEAENHSLHGKLFTRNRPGMRDALAMSVPCSEVWRIWLVQGLQVKQRNNFQSQTHLPHHPEL